MEATDVDDSQLDTLLQQARPAISVEAEQLARQLASDTALRRSLLQRLGDRFRSRPLVPIAAAALALTGAGTTAAYQLHVPPFVTVVDADSRTAGIPLDFRTDAGTEVACQAFLDYRDLDRHQVEQLDHLVDDTDWSQYGQRLYDSLPTQQQQVQTGPGPTGDLATQDLQTRIRDSVTGVGWLEPSGPAITAVVVSCSYPDGAPNEQ